MMVSHCDFVKNPDLYLKVISVRFKAFIQLSHKSVDGVLIERPW